MLSRRAALAGATCSLALHAAGCASPADLPAPAAADGALRAWRSLSGGFLGSAVPGIGGPALPGAGAFIRLVFPSALALRDNEMLIVDSGSARLYRADIALNTLIPIAGAPATPQTRVALGPDLSAFVLDPAARRVLRFARDGRLIQTFRADDSLAAPTGFALTRSGSAVVIADRTLAQIAIVGMAGGTVVPLRALRPDGAAAGGAAAIAAGQDDLYLLDQAAGRVHRVGLDGLIRASFGAELAAPTLLEVDRFERVYVAEPQVGRIRVFADDRLVRTWTAAELGVQRIGGIAVDGSQLAVSDVGTGRVSLFRLPGPP